MTLRWDILLKSVCCGIALSPASTLCVLLLASTWPLGSLSRTLSPYLIFISGPALAGIGFGSWLAPQRRFIHAAAAGILSTLAAWLIAFSLLPFVIPSPHDDWQLIRRFERNEAVFNELLQAVKGRGGLESISPTQVEPLNTKSLSVSAEKLETYRVGAQRLHLTWVGKASQTPETVYFNVKARRGADIVKNYMYSKDPPIDGKIVARITEAEVKKAGLVYRPIQNGWYLFARTTSD